MFQNLVKDLATMTEARNEALKCLEHAKQTSNPTSGISDSDLKASSRLVFLNLNLILYN